MKQREQQTISIVIPAYNEAEAINEFHNKLLVPSLSEVNCKIIYVNDGSTDSTLDKLREISRSDPRVCVIDLSRNFGKEIAVTAGITYSDGDATVILDADGQHPPKLIPEFIEKWLEGAQVVIGVRREQQHEGFIKGFGSRVFYRLFNSSTGVKLVPRSTDFRLISREVREEFVKMQERSRITRGLIDWLGYHREYIHFDSPERIAGEASYKTSSLVKLAINSFTSLSLKPLFFFGWVGTFLMISSLVLGVFIIIEQFVLGDPLNLDITASAMLGVLMLFLISLTLISQAMLSMYIAHIHEQSQARPLFIVNKKTSVNLDNDQVN